MRITLCNIVHISKGDEVKGCLLEVSQDRHKLLRTAKKKKKVDTRTIRVAAVVVTKRRQTMIHERNECNNPVSVQHKTTGEKWERKRRKGGKG